MLYGICAFVFSATLCWCVMFCVIPVFAYLGTFTLLSSFLKPILTDVVVSQMSLVGNILILAIGVNLIEVKKFKVGNMLPSIFLPLIYSLLVCLSRNVNITFYSKYFVYSCRNVVKLIGIYIAFTKEETGNEDQAQKTM